MNSIRQASLSLFIVLTLAASAQAQDTIPWVTDLNQARRMAEEQQRLVLLHFWSDNCQPCQHVETNVFNQPELIRVVNTGFIPVKIHYQQQPKIAAFYKVDRFPTDIIVLPNGAEVFRTVSPSKANSYIAMLDQVRANAMTNGLQGVSQIAQKASSRAQDAIAQITPLLPPLPAEPGSTEPTAVTPDLSSNDQVPTDASSGGDWRTASNQRQTTDVRSSTVTNQFIDPLDQKTSPRPSGTSQRYGNPYLDEPMVPADSTNVQPEHHSTLPSGGVTQQPSVPSNQNGTWQVTPGLTGNAGFPNQTTSPSVPPQQSFGGNQKPLNQSQISPPAWNNAGPPAQQPNLNGQLGNQGPAHTNLNQNSFVPQNPGNAPNLGGSTNNAGQQPPTLPPGAPPLALDGFCPVTLLESHRWEQGNPQFGAIHRGRTYLFKSQIERDRFLAAGSADHYAPVLSGFDPVRFVELNQSVEGNRAYGVVYQQHIYLFADEQALVQFEQQPEKYVQVVRQAMANARMTPQR